MTTTKWIKFFLQWLWLATTPALTQSQLAPWQKLAPMPTPRYGLAAVVWRDQIVALGGRDSLNQTSVKAESYDPATKTWSRFAADLQEARFNAAAVVYHDAIYIIGGSRGDSRENQILNTVERYDEQNSRWEILETRLQVGRDGPAAAVLQDTLLAIGGFDEGGVYLKSLERYDPATQQWSFARWQLTLARASLEALSLNDSLFTFGGLFFGPVPLLERYHFVHGGERRADMLTARGNMASAVLLNRLWAIGGTAQEGPTSAVEYYDPVLSKWFEDKPILRARELHAAVAYDNQLYMLGGRDVNQHVLADLEVTSPASTGVQEKNENVPGNFVLHGYPNPFRTHVRLLALGGAEKTGVWRFEIFALNGALVRTLPVMSGANEVSAVWDGRDAEGRTVAGGVYIIRVQLGAQNVMKKIIKLDRSPQLQSIK